MSRQRLALTITLMLAVVIGGFMGAYVVSPARRRDQVTLSPPAVTITIARRALHVTSLSCAPTGSLAFGCVYVW